MTNIDLRLDYLSDNFGKPNHRGEWPIRGDVKKYCLYVDEIPVIDIELEYQRFDSSSPNYSCVYISYYNNFFRTKNPNYNNQGYATIALKLVTEILLNERVPRLVLDILDDNERSKRVAAKAGYQRIKFNEYSVFNPAAIEMYEEGLKPLKEEDEELYYMQMDRNLYLFQKYTACLKASQEKVLSHAR